MKNQQQLFANNINQLQSESFHSLPVIEKMEILSQVITYADWKYYVKDDAILADVDYDKYYKWLLKLEQDFPELSKPNSPTQRVAYGISEKLDTVQHLVPMLSLENSYNEADLADWDKKNKKSLVDSFFYTVEPKYDGASISLIYENDLLVRGATRGDGIYGENITHNVKMIRNVPLSIPLAEYGLQSIEIRGEVIIPNKDFALVNEQRIQQGLAPLANPRNAASGSLRILDGSEVAKRKLSAILYHISDYTLLPGAAKPAFLDSHYSSCEWLDNVGCATSIALMKKSSAIEDILSYCEYFEQERDNLGYEIDGMVIKVDSLSAQEKLGMTSHHPRWAMAYKFKARQATSPLLEVQFQVGRTGIITPVAKIQPVYIGGVTVSSISLFNEDVIKEKDIRIGDQLIVERAGDVIPYIVKSLTELRTGAEQPIIFPTNCPVCNGPISKVEGEAAYKCTNWDCEAQLIERLIHFASKDAMDIRNLGDANIKRFFELGMLNSLTDIYKLPYEQLAGLDKLGKKSIENLKQAIEASKNQPTFRLIFGLGIRYVGINTAKTLSRAVDDIRLLKEWTIEEFMALEDIGPKVAQSLYSFFKDAHHQQLLDELADLGLSMKEDKVANDSGNIGKLNGKTFLFTGTLDQLKRNEAEAQVEALGGKILSGVSSKLNYLIVGAAAGSKLEKAKKLGTVSILSEQEFIGLIAAQ